jgi:hypothetical protein
MPIKTHVAAFNEHLKDVRKSKKLADKAIRSLAPASLHAGKAITIAWEATFDLITQEREKLTLERIDEFAAVIYKLAQGHRLSQSTTQREHEYAELRLKLREVTEGLSPELRDKLEQNLDILKQES